jgi:oligopeptidase B
MMRRTLPLAAASLGFVAFLVLLHGQPDEPRPPVATQVPKVTEIHGDRLVDNYYWLRGKQDPEVIKYLQDENAYTDAVMKPTAPLQNKLYREFLSRIDQTDSTAPVRMGAWSYYSRTREGKQYPIYCRKAIATGAREQVILDVNALAADHKFYKVNVRVVSDDGNLLAYSSDTTGFREYTLHVKDLHNGELLPDELRKVDSVAWASDNRTLYYVTEDNAKRAYRLWRHKLGDAQAQDTLLYEEKDELFDLTVSRSADKQYVLLNIVSYGSTEVRYLKRDGAAAGLQMVLPREENHRYEVEHRDGLFYIRTNKGAKNFRLVTAPVATPDAQHWTELIPHRPAVMLDTVHVFADHLVLEERFNGLERIAVFDPATKRRSEIAFDEPTYDLDGAANPEFNAKVFRVAYESFTTPPSVFEYDTVTGERRRIKATKVLGGYEPKHYKTERIWATAADGARVPISLVYNRQVKLDGSAPLLLDGYGAYGSTNFADFQAARFSLLDRGMVYAIAHVRGGGELGEPWHDAGKMLNKRNSFTDFIACAEHLFARQYTSKNKLAIQGASAGGLLMGGVLALRPDLPRVAILQVPFVDVINTMLDETLPLTVGEFLEWGNPKNADQYWYMKSYCPYTNLHKTHYPTMLVTTSFNDSQVMYWEPAKYVAKLRTLKTDFHPLLLKCNMNAGHGGASGRYDALHERAFTYAFLLTQLGVEK